MTIAAPPASASSSTWFISSDTTLTADFSGQIVVVGSGVTLNCAGHLVSGEGSGVGINVAANGVAVTNCRVQAFDTGIQTTTDATHIVSNDVGRNGEGIRLAGATDAAVSGNTATHNQSWGIIAAEGATDNTIEHNTANENGVLGIVLDSSFGNVVTGNVAQGNVDSGIRLNGATSNTISFNTANKNQAYGIFDFAQGEGDNRIVSNTANNNDVLGIVLDTTSGDVVSGNSANQNGDTGVATNLSSGNRILNNASMHNGNAGFGFESASGNTVSGNSATDNGTPGNGCGFCFNDSSSNTVSQNGAFRNGGVGFFAFFGSQFNVFSGNRGCQNFFVDAADISTGAGNTWIDNRFCTTEGIS